MPTLHRVCPGCRRAKIASPIRLCPPCARAREIKRGTASARGYGARWQRIAKVIIARDPICTLCGVRASTEADHIVPKARGGSDEMDNLRGTCRPCNAGRRD